MTVSQRRNSRSASAVAPTTTRPPTPISTGLSPAPSSSLVAADVGVSVAAGWSGVGEGVSPSVGVASGVGVGVALEGGADGGVAPEDGVDVGVALGDDVRADVDRDVGVGDSVSFEANVRVGVEVDVAVGVDVGVSVRFGCRCPASTPPPAWPSHGQASMPAAAPDTERSSAY